MSSVVCKLYLDKPVIDNTYLLSMLYETKPEGTLLSDVGTARALGKEVPDKGGRRRGGMCWFPIAALTNYCKPMGFIQ